MQCYIYYLTDIIQALQSVTSPRHAEENHAYVKLAEVEILVIQNTGRKISKRDKGKGSFQLQLICFCFHYAKRQPISANNIGDLFICRRASGVYGALEGVEDRKAEMGKG